MTVAPAGIAIHRYDLAVDWSEALWSPLSRAERDRAERYAREDDRRRFVAGRHLIRTRLARILGCAADDVPITIGDHGRPYVAGVPSFSLSHAGGRVLLAIADDHLLRVGIDVEAIRHDIDPIALGRAICTPIEMEALRRAPDRTALFFRLWTIKEAVLKAIGRGLLVDPRAVCVDLSGDTPVLVAVPDALSAGACVELAPIAGYAGALAWC